MTHRLDTQIELSRVDLAHLVEVLQGLESELVDTLGSLISLRPAGVDELLIIGGATDAMQEALAHVDLVKTRLANHAARLELQQQEAAELYFAAYGRPEAEVAA